MDINPEEFSRLVSLLEGLEYVFCSGFAASICVENFRETEDLDIAFKSRKELEKFMERADRVEEDVTELLEKEIEFGELVLDLNVKANKLSGKYLNKVFEERNRKEFRGEEVFVTPLEELIVQKKSLGREKDLEDIQQLEELEYDRELLAFFEEGLEKN